MTADGASRHRRGHGGARGYASDRGKGTKGQEARSPTHRQFLFEGTVGRELCGEVTHPTAWKRDERRQYVFVAHPRADLLGMFLGQTNTATVTGSVFSTPMPIDKRSQTGRVLGRRRSSRHCRANRFSSPPIPMRMDPYVLTASGWHVSLAALPQSGSRRHRKRALVR